MSNDAERDTGQLDPAILPLPQPQPAVRWPWLVGIGVGVVFALLLLVLWWRPTPVDPQPVLVVQQFAQALEQRDLQQLLATLEPTVLRRELSPELRSYLEYVELFRFENPSFILIEQQAQRARVRWQATAIYRLNLGSSVTNGSQTFQAEVELRQIEGQWYIRGFRQP